MFFFFPSVASCNYQSKRHWNTGTLFAPQHVEAAVVTDNMSAYYLGCDRKQWRLGGLGESTDAGLANWRHPGAGD